MIAVCKTFKKSFKEIWNHPLNWIRIVFLPFVILFLGLAGANFLLPGQDSFVFAQTVPVISVVIYPIYFIAITGFYIKGFRYAALKEGGDKWWDFPFNIRLVKMFLYFLLISFLVVIYVGISAGITIALNIILGSVFVTVLFSVGFVVLGLYLITRLVLTFLYVAIDKEKPLRTSWYVMKGNVWRLLLLLVLISLIFLAVNVIILGGLFLFVLFIGGWFTLIFYAFVLFINVLILFVSIAWTINAIAYVNKQLTQK